MVWKMNYRNKLAFAITDIVYHCFRGWFQCWKQGWFLGPGGRRAGHCLARCWPQLNPRTTKGSLSTRPGVSSDTARSGPNSNRPNLLPSTEDVLLASSQGRWWGLTLKGLSSRKAWSMGRESLDVGGGLSAQRGRLGSGVPGRKAEAAGSGGHEGTRRSRRPQSWPTRTSSRASQGACVQQRGQEQQPRAHRWDGGPLQGLWPQQRGAPL